MCIDRSYVGDNVAAMRVDRPYLTSSRERLPLRAIRVVSAVCAWRPAAAAVHATQNLGESPCERALYTRCRPSALGIQSNQLASQNMHPPDALRKTYKSKYARSRVQKRWQKIQNQGFHEHVKLKIGHSDAHSIAKSSENKGLKYWAY